MTLLSACLALTAAKCSPADTLLVHGDGQPVGGHWQKWIDNSRAPTPPGQVTIWFRACPVEGWIAGACVIAPRTIYLPPEVFAGRTRPILFHELGHVFDFTVLTDHDRNVFRGLFGIRRQWSTPATLAGGRVAGDLTARERFAEAYYACATGDRDLAFPFRPAVLRTACSTIPHPAPRLTRAAALRHARYAMGAYYTPAYANRHGVRRCKRGTPWRFHCSGTWAGPKTDRDGVRWRHWCSLIFDVYIREGEGRPRHSSSAEVSTCEITHA